jgi:prevent-host-death family protein
MSEKRKTLFKSGNRSELAVLRDSAVAEWGRIVTVRDAKAHLSALLEGVAAGHELTITSDGQPKAKLVSVTAGAYHLRRTAGCQWTLF